jgi:hypothetical protein
MLPWRVDTVRRGRQIAHLADRRLVKPDPAQGPVWCKLRCGAPLLRGGARSSHRQRQSRSEYRR